MRKTVLLIILIIATILPSFSTGYDTIIIKSDDSSERINRDLDSLLSTWYVKLAVKNASEKFTGDTSVLIYPDSLYRDRLSKINSVIQLPYNNIIKNHIHVYTVRQREKFCAVLGLMDYYFPMFEDVFDSYGLPAELKYMAIIESALNPNAVNSRSHATGLWQFMYSTGRMYGLTINSVVDERRDPMKSTVAAAKYIRDLYKIYNDWMLVIAAYNCGPGNVNKAIRRSGNKKDYWEIYYRLPRETRGYIPQYIAAVYGVTYAREHGLNPLPLNIPVAVDTIMVNKDIHLAQISEVMGIPLGELRALNPQYRTGLVPGSSKPLALTLPMTHLGDFIDLNDTIRRYKPDVYLNKETQIADPTKSSYLPADVKGKTKLIYTVQEGDNLGFISDWYRVSLSDIRYWNNIYRNTIRIGQKLVVYVDPSKSEYFSKISTMTFAEKQQMTGKTVPANTSAKTVLAGSYDTEGDYIVHTVRNGDTIWDIVKMYDNVTSTQVLSLNNISDPGKIKIGQKLKIKKKS
ncbi:MAG: transglycosylase SLT domain-containing protein [Bacteroidetes bacterium]|nr:transglycosylase SLT domain-containing protein [Bacteroidota bacterium]